MQRSRAPLASRRCGVSCHQWHAVITADDAAVRRRRASRPEYWLNLQAAHDPPPRKARSAARSALNGSPDVHGDRGLARPQALGPLYPGDRAGAGLAVRSGSLKKGDDDA